MGKITKMTKGQAARMEQFARDWIAIGLSTEPADFDTATTAALKAYELCNLGKPMVILRMGSPYGATLGGILAWGLLREMGKQVRSQVRSQVESQVRSQVRSQVESQVWSQVRSQIESQIESQVESQIESQVRSQVWSQVRSQVGSQVESQVESQVWSQVRSQVWSQVRSQVWSQVESQVWSQVESQVWSQVGSQVRSQVRSQVESQVWSQVWSGIYNDRGGAFWSSWCAYVAFMRDELGWSDPVLDRFAVDETLTKSCGWVWWHENVLAISDRPSAIHRDDQWRLHCESGPSIAYRDGWALHHWHGVLVPDWVIESPATITVRHIEDERNAEVRRVLITRYGEERYLNDSGAELIASDDVGDLYRKTVPDDEPLVMVRVLNSTPEPDGSIRPYTLRVPPDMRTPREAIAWTFGLAAKDYQPRVQT